MLQRIGPFEVLRELGRGGMGVVYLANDARLDRQVAIKALPAELAADPARLERFEREARTLAQLNHPNLAGIHGVEEQDGFRYLVLEYVAGESLADRLDRGPVPMDEAVEYAVQIAAGLEAAHDAGVIHRDLKPANVMITPAGQAKVLDFGLARTDEGESSSAGGLDSPTMTAPQPRHSPTIAGAILGTAAYMSPEQARGRSVDKRTDVWSFGVVLYEMLVGASPFHGETATDSIGAVLHKDLALERVPAGTPQPVRRVLQRCLVRDRNRRYRDIGDVRIELLGFDDEAPPPRLAERRRSVPVPAVLGLTGLAAVAAFGAAWVMFPRAAAVPDASVAHLSLELPKDRRIADWPYPTLSPDGTRLILRRWGDEGFSIIVRDLDDPEPRRLETPGDVGEMSLSPDGEWVLYDARDMLYRMSITGGPAIPVCESPETRGTAWGEAGVVVFAPANRGPLHRVDIDTGQAEPLYELPAGEPISDRHPSMLPGNRGVLFVRSTGDVGMWTQTSLWVVDLEGGEPRQLVRDASHGRFVAPGYLVFQREGALMAAAFDLDRMELTSPEYPVLQDLDEEGTGRFDASTPARFDVSRSGTLVYLEGETAHIDRRMERVTIDGVASPFSERVGPFRKVMPSDDGELLAVEITSSGEPNRIAIFEPGRDLLKPIRGHAQSDDSFPTWSPDGRWLAFSSNRHGGVFNVYRHRVGSTAEPERIIESDLLTFPEDWSNDGRTLLLSIGRGNGDVNISLIRFDEHGNTTGEVEPLIDWADNQFQARFSPDDRWVGFTSFTPDGGYGIFVIDAADPTRSVQVSTGGSSRLVWDTHRDRLYYTSTNDGATMLMGVDYEVGEDGSFIPAQPRLLFELDGAGTSPSLQMIDDGQAFIHARPADKEQASADRGVSIVLNWHEELRRRVAQHQR